MFPYNLAFRYTPTILERILDQISPERYDESINPDRFNLTQMVAHLADAELIFLDRCVMGVEKPGTVVEPFDEGQRAVEKNYAEKDLRHELAVFANRRRETVAYLESLNEDQLSGYYSHPVLGDMTIPRHIAFLTGHDLYHIEQTTEYLTRLNELVP
jgi:uncharacterized damage-inducible protein DinB